MMTGKNNNMVSGVKTLSRFKGGLGEQSWRVCGWGGLSKREGDLALWMYVV